MSTYAKINEKEESCIVLSEQLCVMGS